MHLLSALDLHRGFLRGDFSAEEIARGTLNRISTYDPEIGAFLSLFEPRLLQKAQNLDQKRARKAHLGKLAAVPVAIKDNIVVRGEITTCGSKFLSNYRAVFDATAVRLLEEEDALIVGKTNLDEFAMGSSTENSAYKTTKNPWNLACSPGGSSGGSAAAVAARLVPLALGSDTGGSIRQPAALTGVVGFKPSYGRVSRYGLVAFGSSLDQIGPFAGSVEEVALTLEVIGRHCPHDATSLPIATEPYLEGLKAPQKKRIIGVPWSFLEGLPPDAHVAFDETIKACRSLGWDVVDVDLNVLRSSISVYYVLATAEASTNLARFDGVRYGVRSSRATTIDEVFDLSRAEGFGPEVKRRILLGTYVLSAGYQDAYYKQAQKVRTLMIDGFRSAFAKCDLVATPTSPIPAFPFGAFQDPLQMYLQDLYTIPANLTGLPAISLPCKISDDGKPWGVQLTAPFFHDGALLNAAHMLEKQLNLSTRVPKRYE
jgi:aspartyl-tRNA(Asn)/glutamyl-tRNA(Gln) amidotransferase subunit A